MFKIPKQEYTVEFKELAGKRVKSGETVGAVARDLGLVEQTLRNWVKAAKADKLHAPGAKTVTPEQMEPSRVRAENARLRMEVEILKFICSSGTAAAPRKRASGEDLPRHNRRPVWRADAIPTCVMSC